MILPRPVHCGNCSIQNVFSLLRWYWTYFQRHTLYIHLYKEKISNLSILDEFNKWSSVTNFSSHVKELSYSMPTVLTTWIVHINIQKVQNSTLLYEMPSNSKGKNFVWKIYCFFSLNLRVLPATDPDGSTCKFSEKYLQKVNAKLPQIYNEKRSFSSFINNFKTRIKSCLSKSKHSYFPSHI